MPKNKSVSSRHSRFISPEPLISSLETAGARETICKADGKDFMRVTRRSAIRLLTASALLPAMESLPAVPASPNTNRGTYKDASLPIERRVQDLLARMTVEEKARQLDMYAALTDGVQALANGTHTFSGRTLHTLPVRSHHSPNPSSMSRRTRKQSLIRTRRQRCGERPAWALSMAYIRHRCSQTRFSAG